jgi:hypothetical protein
MEPKYITFEQAKWLKEKGYEIDSNEVLFCRDEINNIEEHQIKNRDIIRARGIGYILDDDEYRVYEQHQVVDWLLEKHGIFVVVLPILYNGDAVMYYPSIFEQGVGEDIEEYFNSPQEAYSAAFDYIKNNNLI